MAESGLTYSRFVAFLKVILPLSALALLSTLFLISRNIGGTSTDAIPFAQIDLEERARRQQVTAPFFSGKTSSGHLVSFTAEQALPDAEDPRKSHAEQMDARVDLMDGSHLTITSDHAEVDNRHHTTVLQGNVVITSSNGFTMRTSELSASMRDLEAESTGEVTGDGPAGDFTAGKMQIFPSEKPDEATLFFSQGVKLIYTPPS